MAYPLHWTQVGRIPTQMSRNRIQCTRRIGTHILVHNLDLLNVMAREEREPRRSVHHEFMNSAANGFRIIYRRLWPFHGSTPSAGLLGDDQGNGLPQDVPSAQKTKRRPGRLRAMSTSLAACLYCFGKTLAAYMPFGVAPAVRMRRTWSCVSSGYEKSLSTLRLAAPLKYSRGLPADRSAIMSTGSCCPTVA